MGGAVDGIDFKGGEKAETIKFKLAIEGRQQPAFIYIGSKGEHPSKAEFTLPARRESDYVLEVCHCFGTPKQCRSCRDLHCFGVPKQWHTFDQVVVHAASVMGDGSGNTSVRLRAGFRAPTTYA